MSDLSQFAPPPPVSEEDEVKYIGPGGSSIPANLPGGSTSGIYEPYRGPATRDTIKSRYAQGDEWEPQTQSWSPERVADIQAQLVDAGLLDPDDYQRGFWDEESAQAYRQLLGYSNVSGLDSHQTLQRIGEVKAKYGTTDDKAKIREPFIAQLSDPVALSDLLDDVAVRRMGRGLTPEEKNQFSNSFRGLEEAEERKRYEAGGSGLPGGPGGTYTEVDPQARAEQYVTETRPDDVAAYQYLQAFKSFENLLSRTRR